MLDALNTQRLTNKVIIEIGTGSSTIINSLSATNLCMATDVNPFALKNARCCAIRSNLLRNVNQENVDVVVFNPPYVNEPIEGCRGESCDRCWEMVSCAGGKDGSEIILEFLSVVRVKEFYLLVIRRNQIDLEKVKGYAVSVIKERRILGETIFILHGVKCD